MIKICEYCNNEFKAKKPKAKYCDRKCHSDYMRDKGSREIVCDFCNTKFRRVLGKINKTRNFCTLECKHEAFRNIPIAKKKGFDEKLVCNFCKDVFYRKNYKTSSKSKSVYCSLDCLHKSQAKLDVECECGYCGKIMFKKPRDLKRNDGQGYKKNVYCNMECMGAHYSESKMFSGENSSTWLGGDISEYGRNWQHQRKKALKRDGYVCQDCGIHNDDFILKMGQGLSIHHIKPFRDFGEDWETANHIDNLISVCESCHRVRHKDIHR